MDNKKITLYCHFSFKRPKNKPGKCYLACAFYQDYAAKKLIAKRVVERNLWVDHQFITGAQAYEFALSTIYIYQGILISKGVNQIMLVTDNSILAGWITDPKKHKNFANYIERANSMYRVFAPKEITLGIGLCKVWEYEKSYKYCKEQYVEKEDNVVNKNEHGENKLDIAKQYDSVQTIDDLMKEDIAKPEIK